jgi:hypothetical protein
MKLACAFWNDLYNNLFCIGDMADLEDILLFKGMGMKWQFNYISNMASPKGTFVI